MEQLQVMFYRGNLKFTGNTAEVHTAVKRKQLLWERIMLHTSAFSKSRTVT
jgi:hypothetical protein